MPKDLGREGERKEGDGGRCRRNSRVYKVVRQRDRAPVEQKRDGLQSIPEANRGLPGRVVPRRVWWCPWRRNGATWGHRLCLFLRTWLHIFCSSNQILRYLIAAVPSYLHVAKIPYFLHDMYVPYLTRSVPALYTCTCTCTCVPVFIYSL
jgi:hypothetical protein